MAGIAYYSGIRRLGAAVIRVGPGVPALQWETISRLKPTVVVAVPSFLLKLIRYAKDYRVDLQPLFGPVGHLYRREHPSGRSFAEYPRQKDHRRLEYPAIFHLCQYRDANGLYRMQRRQGAVTQPELLIVELLDEQDRKLGAGVPGEVTITTLGIEGMPRSVTRPGISARGPTNPAPADAQASGFHRSSAADSK